MTDDPRAAAFYEALDSDQAWRLAAEYGRGAAMKVLLPAVLACHERLLKAAPPAEGPTCAPMEDWRGANEEGRKR